MTREESGSPATLVAIVVAARRVRDRELETQARRELERRYGVTLRFSRNRERPTAVQGVNKP